jgi:hypothetical protein
MDQEAGWGPRGDLDTVEKRKILACQESNPGRLQAGIWKLRGIREGSEKETYPCVWGRKMLSTYY